MRVFWEPVIEPLLVAARPERIIEIGIDRGDTTALLAAWAASHSATVDSIDPDPSIDVGEWSDRYGEALRIHLATSLEALAQLEPADVVLIDGDHNFYTVLGELRLLERRAQERGALPAVVALHDVGWPYARRDLYYAPERIPETARQPYARGGIDLDEPGLARSGFNDHLFNAVEERPSGSGVLGGIEQFLSESLLEWRFVTVPGDHGLGVLAATTRLAHNGRLSDLLDEFESAAFFRRRAEQLEHERLRERIRATAAQKSTVGAEAVEAAEHDLEQAREAFELERQGLEQELAAADGRAAERTAEAEQLRARLADLEEARGREREQERRSIAQLKHQVEESRDDLAEAERARSRLERRLAASEEHEIEAEEAVAAIRRKLRAAELERDDAVSERQRMAARYSTLDDALSKAERDGARRIGELEEALASAERRARAQLEEAERKVAEAAAQATARAEQLVADANHEAEERIDSLRRRSADEMAEAVSALELKLEELRGSAVAAGERAEAAVAARDAAVQELEQTVRAHASLLADLEDSRESTREQLEERSAEAETARHSAAELREALEARELERDQLVQQLVALGDELRAARTDREIAEATCAAMERKLAAIVSADEELRSGTGGGVASGLPAPSLAPTAPPADKAGIAVPWLPTEEEARARFTDQYVRTATILEDGRDFIALPAPEDHRGVLLGPNDAHPSGRPRVDVIVCVHGALEDVRRCVWSLVEKTHYPFHLIIVDDGSDADTAAYLDQVALMQPATTLVRNSGPLHGYTVAANIGLRTSQADYLILLNSDTIVTPGWIDRIVDCGESDDRIGVLGPLSNAASHQSIPELRSEGAWATNPLPRFVTQDGIGLLLERVSRRRRPRFPFINGFCYVVKRAVIDSIGYLDEEHFASGYCEENDFSHRAAEAGFELAVADDAYVYHAKSKSFGVEGRKAIAKRNYKIFLEKHGAEVINAKVAALESDNSLAGLRAITGDALSSRDALASSLELGQSDPLSVVFVLPGLGDGGSGGAHSIYQEVRGLRTLGVPARIALASGGWKRAARAYDDAADVFETFADVDELERVTADADVISATHFKSVELVAELRRRRDDFLPAYYIQDYEPFFFSSADGADFDEALQSYTRIDDCLLFAKTHWLCNIVAERHGRYVAKVEPSLDEQLFVPPDLLGHSGPIRVAAMVRPRTPRRQPTATVAVLDALGRALGDAVELVTFGCSVQDLKTLGGSDRLLRAHRGLLRRAEVAGLLAETDVFVDLSMYQAFGRTALEAMACGSTAVVPRLGGVWEFVEDGINAIAVDALAPGQAFQALEELCRDAGRVAGMRLAAQATGQRYSILRAALSEYVLFKREHTRRLQPEIGSSPTSRST